MQQRKFSSTSHISDSFTEKAQMSIFLSHEQKSSIFQINLPTGALPTKPT
jgi:hypothetical protein